MSQLLKSPEISWIQCHAAMPLGFTAEQRSDEQRHSNDHRYKPDQ